MISPHFQVFTELDEPDSALEKSRALYRGAADFVRSHSDSLYHVSRADLARAVKTARGYEYRQENAELATRLGIDHYKKIDADAAVTYLESALDTYQDLQYDLVEAHKVAEVALYLALSYIEQDNTTLKLFDRFQTMTLLDPELRIRPGYYPERIVNFYRSARDSLLSILRAEGPQARDAEKLVDLADSDYAVYGYAWPEEDGRFEVALFIYSREEKTFLAPLQMTVADGSPSTFYEAANRLISRAIPAILAPNIAERPEDPTVVQSRGESPLSLDFGFAYASFWKFPFDERARTKPWGNYGLSVAARVFMTRNFTMIFGGHILSSTRDYSGFLFDDFSTLRGFAGGDLGVDLWGFNLGGQLGLEATMLGDFDACPDLHALCAQRVDRSHAVRIENQGLFLGVNARPRVIWYFSPQFSLIGSGSISYYFIPLSGRNFNFPVTGQLDISYRF